MNKTSSCSNKKRRCQMNQISSINNDSIDKIRYQYRTNEEASICSSIKSNECSKSESRKRHKFNTNNLDLTTAMTDLMKSIKNISLNNHENCLTRDNTKQSVLCNKIQKDIESVNKNKSTSKINNDETNISSNCSISSTADFPFSFECDNELQTFEISNIGEVVDKDFTKIEGNAQDEHLSFDAKLENTSKKEIIVIDDDTILEEEKSDTNNELPCRNLFYNIRYQC